MTRPNTDHVTVSFDSGEIRCGHCADYHTPNCEIPASVLVERLRGFILMHRLCPKPVAPSPQLPLPGTEPSPCWGCNSHPCICDTEGATPLGHDHVTAPGEFDRRYPRARTHQTLISDLLDIGCALDYGQLAAINALHEDSGKFDAIAHWARVSKAWAAEHPNDRDLGPAPTWLPKPVPRPEAWTEIVNAGVPVGNRDVKPPKKKRGACPLTSPNGKGKHAS